MTKFVRRISPRTMEADSYVLTMLQTLSDYKPTDPAYSKEAVMKRFAATEAARAVEANVHNALKAARDAAVLAEWEFHNSILGVKNQVIAQYGEDSDQVQALGLKKKSEAKPSARRKKKI